MQGQMMNVPLTITTVMEHARLYHAKREIISAIDPQSTHKTTYGEAFERAAQLANALAALGCKPGERIATLAWNDYRHFEIYYALTCSGAILHTINPRLFEEQLVYIINHAEDQWIFLDPDFVPLLENIQDDIPNVKGFITLCDEKQTPKTSLKNIRCYETLLSEQKSDFEWPELDEYSACSLCYTSGTTGNPKGVLYSHRSIVVHALSVSMLDASGFSANDIVLSIVPMFHVHAWGLPFRAPMIGSKLVFPGRYLGNGEVLQNLITKEKVSFAVGVPTIWQLLIDYLEQSGKKIEPLRRAIVGGAACPQSLFDQFSNEYDVELIQGWGMTELGSVGTVNIPGPDFEHLNEAEKKSSVLKQGRPIFGVQVKITDDEGKELPWDGQTSGHLYVRGPNVCNSYFSQESDEFAVNGWFMTGDVANIAADGTVQITDRSKDLIKSGGEWISSIEIENCALTHPQITEAAVIGAKHEKWGERPFLIAVKRAEDSSSAEDILNWFDGKIASWWKPDNILFVEELPHTATGKVSKLSLREKYGEFFIK
ncbi:MAG: long-chain-fatty-acid--CoA ligase [Gammaproteobacteria bacterium]|nr:long-chain-fatty-acid--CoA ligase [Gammaproteobacteria bacterium]